MVWITVCTVDELEDEDVISVSVAGRRLALYLTPEGEAACTDALCPQDGADLAGGIVEGFRVECPQHEGGFDIRTGAVAFGPAGAPLAVYPARIAGEQVQIDLTI